MDMLIWKNTVGIHRGFNCEATQAFTSESLLSCVAADGMIGDKHSPNMELVAQEAGNIASGVLIAGKKKPPGADMLQEVFSYPHCFC